ncbi:MAG: hypothetical protein AB7F86_05440 [Bdellovibrionales bacterium]
MRSIGRVFFIGFTIGVGAACARLESRPTGNAQANAILQSQAMTLHQRLSVKTSIDNPNITKMAEMIEAGRSYEAALLATKNEGFYDSVVRDFAVKMSNREESVRNPLNDFVATVIGIARDDIDARQMLTGNFFYYAPSESPTDASLVYSNAHYENLENKREGIVLKLARREGQLALDEDGTPRALKDSAGVITSRAFMSSHALGGTNRRLVEFAFSEFLCSPIEEWANTTIPDGYVGRDVGRMPADLYKGKCVGCHAPMDALRPAFAYVNFETTAKGSATTFQATYRMDPRDTQPDVIDVPVPSSEQKVPSKFRRNRRVFSDGFVVNNNAWENFTSPRFGWRGSLRGNGMQDFGQMLANSRRFSECMVKRAYQAVCYEEFPKDRADLLYDLSEAFEAEGYKLRNLFAHVAVQPECTGGEAK